MLEFIVEKGKEKELVAFLEELCDKSKDRGWRDRIGLLILPDGKRLLVIPHPDNK